MNNGLHGTVIFTVQLSMQAESNFKDVDKLLLQRKSAFEEEGIFIQLKNALNELKNCIYKSCDAKRGKCKDFCAGANITAFNNILNDFSPCYDKKTCGYGLQYTGLENVYQSIDNGRCALHGDYVTVRGMANGLKTATGSTTKDSVFHSQEYNVKNNINLVWTGLAIKCFSDRRRSTIETRNFFSQLSNQDILCSSKNHMDPKKNALLAKMKIKCDWSFDVGAEAFSFQQELKSNTMVVLDTFYGQSNVSTSNINSIDVSFIDKSELSNQQIDAIQSYFSSSEFVELYKEDLMNIQAELIKTNLPYCSGPGMECLSI